MQKFYIYLICQKAYFKYTFVPNSIQHVILLAFIMYLNRRVEHARMRSNGIVSNSTTSVDADFFLLAVCRKAVWI